MIADFLDEYRHVIDKVRKTVKIFRKSPTKNDEILQPYVKKDHSRELNLILDCKTRWNSLLDILSRFKNLRVPIQKALIDLKLQNTLSDADFITVGDLVSTLEQRRADRSGVLQYLHTGVSKRRVHPAAASVTSAASSATSAATATTNVPCPTPSDIDAVLCVPSQKIIREFVISLLMRLERHKYRTQSSAASGK